MNNLLFQGAIALSTVSASVFLAQCATAYPLVRLGIIVILLVIIAYLSFLIWFNGRVLRMSSQYGDLNPELVRSVGIPLVILVLMAIGLVLGVFSGL